MMLKLAVACIAAAAGISTVQGEKCPDLLTRRTDRVVNGYKPDGMAGLWYVCFMNCSLTVLRDEHSG